jgi:glucose/arabinose dehydrogenase
MVTTDRRANSIRVGAGKFAIYCLCAATIAGVGGCGETATLPLAAGFGSSPQLPPPHPTMFPTINIATAKGWPSGQTPTPAEGFQVRSIAAGLDHPRWIYVLPNDDILIAESNAPPKPDDGRGIRGWAMHVIMGRAGADVPSANRITLLRYTPDGVARTTFLEGLNSPFGMALIGHDLYVADTDALLRFPYQRGQTHIGDQGVKVADLPAGPINHHWTKNVVVSPDGSRLYVTVGSNSNAGENGMAVEAGRASIWEIDPKTGQHRVYASGLRNPVGLSWEPNTKTLWTAVNERDEIGSDLVPDYMTSVKDGAFYGWPYSYYGQHIDERVKPERPDLVSRAVSPDYALGAHTASLGLAFSGEYGDQSAFPPGAYVGQHGSWNRRPHSGYKVIYVPFQNGRPAGPPSDILTGFLNPDEHALGRPVGVAFDHRGALLVADDVGNQIWRVTVAPEAVISGQSLKN